jgi:hypothetical protein
VVRPLRAGVSEVLIRSYWGYQRSSAFICGFIIVFLGGLGALAVQIAGFRIKDSGSREQILPSCPFVLRGSAFSQKENVES